MEHQINILIVEDMYNEAVSMQDILLDAGYKVVGIASSGEKALEMLKEKSVDVILMDIDLEGKMDGVETARQISEIYDLDIIYLTGLQDKRTYTRAKASPHHFFLSKPFNKYQLLDTIDTVFNVKNDINNNTIEPSFSYSKDFIYIKTNKSHLKYSVDDVIYLKAYNSYTDIYFKNKALTISKGLGRVIKNINHPQIIRVSRSYAINLKKIIAIEDWLIKLDGKDLSIKVDQQYKNVINKVIKKI